MSDTQQPSLSTEQRQRIELMAQRQQAQQRQILAMMGIGQWVSPNTKTLKISDIDTTPNTSSQAIAPSVEQPTLESAESNHLSNSEVEVCFVSDRAPVTADSDPVINTIIDSDTSTSIDTRAALAQTTPAQKVDLHSRIESTESLDSIEDLDSIVRPSRLYHFDDLNSFNDTEEFTADSGIDRSLSEKVAPFDLQGTRYGNWVLMVDIQALDNDSQKLWQNITQALSLECETSSFPICVGMDTVELANASLAGYIFRIGQSEDIKVAVLTALPAGLIHPNIREVPSLETMLSDGTRKRDLWRLIST